MLLPVPPELELALEPAGPDEPAPLAPEEPPDWPCVLPTALAPVPALSRHSFGMALFEAYFDSSQRASFCATCDLGVASVELMEPDGAVLAGGAL